MTIFSPSNLPASHGIFVSPRLILSVPKLASSTETESEVVSPSITNSGSNLFLYAAIPISSIKKTAPPKFTSVLTGILSVKSEPMK